MFINATFISNRLDESRICSFDELVASSDESHAFVSVICQHRVIQLHGFPRVN